MSSYKTSRVNLRSFLTNFWTWTEPSKNFWANLIIEIKYGELILNSYRNSKSCWTLIFISRQTILVCRKCLRISKRIYPHNFIFFYNKQINWLLIIYSYFTFGSIHNCYIYILVFGFYNILHFRFPVFVIQTCSVHVQHCHFCKWYRFWSCALFS